MLLPPGVQNPRRAELFVTVVVPRGVVIPLSRSRPPDLCSKMLFSGERDEFLTVRESRIRASVTHDASNHCFGRPLVTSLVLSCASCCRCGLENSFPTPYDP